jgi:hypothetical protein
MTAASQPIFVLSSGRSGTKLMERFLGAYENVDMQHEYMVHYVQPIAVKYQLGLANRHEVRHVLAQTHRAALHYSDKPIWGDASNKLTWVIDILDELFPQSRFIYLVRDGRKVASSYFHKLGQECYDDRSTAALSDYVEHYPSLPAPPPEKKYWWPQPRRGAPGRSPFLAYSQFDRIVWHWAETHRTICARLKAIAPARQVFVKLEDLAARPDEAFHLTRFLGLPDRAEYAALLARPHNVNRPQDTKLTPEQTSRFWALASDAMHELGYHRAEEYAVNY